MLATRTLASTLDRMITFNHALDQALAGERTGAGRVWVPAIDVAERSDAYVISLDLPGVDPKDIDISFEQNVLTVRGTKQPTLARPSSTSDVRVYANERVAGAFERSIHLPEFVDGEKISADAGHGVLQVTVPKARAAQPRKIEVRAVSQSSDRIQPPSTAKD